MNVRLNDSDLTRNRRRHYSGLDATRANNDSRLHYVDSLAVTLLVE